MALQTSVGSTTASEAVAWLEGEYFEGQAAVVRHQRCRFPGGPFWLPDQEVYVRPMFEVIDDLPHDEGES